MVDRLIINTGNVRRCQHLANNSEANSEALTTLLCTLSCWKRHAGEPLKTSNEILGHPKLLEQISPSERAQRHITVKLFLLDPDAKDTVHDAVAHVCKALGVDSIDLVLLSAPALLAGGKSLPAQYLKHWKDLESSQMDGSVRQIGASDVTLEQLQTLTATSSVPVSDIQVAFDPTNAPCKIKSLYDFATQHDIRVGTHNDAYDMLPQERFAEAIGTHVASGLWRPCWLARYNVFDPARSVITNRGYLIAGARA